MTIRTPNTFIVGAGPVATALAGALRLAGMPVLGLWSRQPKAARLAAATSGVASYSSGPPDILLECEIVIMAVRDQAISEVAGKLVDTGLITKRHVMLHCSGAMSSADAFGMLADRIGGRGTLHPLRAIADGARAMRQLAGTVFGIEGDERGEAEARNLVTALAGKSLALVGEQMAHYHAAAAMASNAMVALVDAAVRLLGRAGITESDALAALLPLASGSLQNIGDQGITRGLTGPVRRGDVATVRRHLDTLAADPEMLAMYRMLGRATLRIAEKTGDLAPGAAEELASLFASDQ